MKEAADFTRLLRLCDDIGNRIHIMSCIEHIWRQQIQGIEHLMIMGHNNLPANTYNKTRLERQRETKKTNDENIKGIPNKDKYSATDATHLTLD